MNILMILYHYTPKDIRVLKEIRVLKKRKVEVTILDIKETSEDNSSNLNTQYVRNSLFKTDLNKRQSFFNLSFFWLYAFVKTLLILKKKRIDVIHCHDLTGLPPGALIKLFFPRIKLIYDSHELFPEAAYDKLGYFSWLIFHLIEKICILFVDRGIGSSPIQKGIFKARYNKTFEILLNVPDLKVFSLKMFNKTKKKSESDGIIRIILSGVVAKHRGYDKLIEVATHFMVEPRQVKFVIAGDGPYLKEIRRKISTIKGLDSIFELTGWINHDQLISLVMQSDIGICLYENTRNNHLMVSNKIFEYMMCRIPFIFSNLKASRPILKEVGAMIVNPDSHPQQIATAIQNLVSDKDRRERISRTARSLINAKYNWDVESKKMISVYKLLFQKRR